MNTPVRLWHVAVILAGTAGGLWLLAPARVSPPDFTSRGFASVRVELRGPSGVRPDELTAASDDPAVVAGLAEVLRSGRSVVVCRCAALGWLEFRRPDGTAERARLMPAHDDGSVEFRPERGRFRVDREWFLRVAGPLGIPAARWYSFPTAEPGGAPQ